MGLAKTHDASPLRPSCFLEVFSFLFFSCIGPSAYVATDPIVSRASCAERRRREVTFPAPTPTLRRRHSSARGTHDRVPAGSTGFHRHPRHPHLVRGLQTGDAIDTAVWVSVHTREASFEQVVVRGTDSGWVEVGRFAGLVPDEGVLQIELVDLVPDTAWSVAPYVDDGQRRSSESRLRTALYRGSIAWSASGRPPVWEATSPGPR